MAQQWASLDAEEKEEYERMAQEAKTKYVTTTLIPSTTTTTTLITTTTFTTSCTVSITITTITITLTITRYQEAKALYETQGGGED